VRPTSASWYRDDENVQARLPWLSTHLGAPRSRIYLLMRLVSPKAARPAVSCQPQPTRTRDDAKPWTCSPPRCRGSSPNDRPSKALSIRHELDDVLRELGRRTHRLRSSALRTPPGSRQRHAGRRSAHCLRHRHRHRHRPSFVHLRRHQCRVASGDRVQRRCLREPARGQTAVLGPHQLLSLRMA